VNLNEVVIFVKKAKGMNVLSSEGRRKARFYYAKSRKTTIFNEHI